MKHRNKFVITANIQRLVHVSSFGSTSYFRVNTLIQVACYLFSFSKLKFFSKTYPRLIHLCSHITYVVYVLLGTILRCDNCNCAILAFTTTWQSFGYILQICWWGPPELNEVHVVVGPSHRPYLHPPHESRPLRRNIALLSFKRTERKKKNKISHNLKKFKMKMLIIPLMTQKYWVKPCKTVKKI